MKILYINYYIVYKGAGITHNFSSEYAGELQARDLNMSFPNISYLRDESNQTCSQTDQ